MSTSGGEQLVPVNGVELCIETFGDHSDPAILLVHGAAASMLWWEDELCRLIADGGRHVVRFDNRDTGRATAYPPGAPGYSLRDLASDAIGVLDSLHIRRAHLVGRSMAGATVALAALDHPERVASLTLVTTTPGDPDLPPMSDGFLRHTSTAPDFGHAAAVVDFIVGLMRAYANGAASFDEHRIRALAERDVRRTRNIASALTNHFLIRLDPLPGAGLADLRVPTLVVHGDQDPVFPLAHGLALHEAIPGSRLLVLEDVGHELPPPTWPRFVAKLLEHTARPVQTARGPCR